MVQKESCDLQLTFLSLILSHQLHLKMMNQSKDPITITAPEPNLTDAITSLSPTQEFQRLKQGRMPCARTAFLAGMATAAGTIGVGFVAGRGQ